MKNLSNFKLYDDEDDERDGVTDDMDKFVVPDRGDEADQDSPDITYITYSEGPPD